jgi:hypothetical protein
VSDIVEFIKFGGGIAGLFSAGFLIWDRLIRHRPTVAPVVVQPDTAALPKELGFIIRNESAWHCYIDKIVTNHKEILVAKFENGTDIYNEKFQEASIIIAPQSAYHVILHDYRDDKTADYLLIVTIEWESSRHWGGILRKLDWPLRIKAPMRRLKSLTLQTETVRVRHR